MEMIPWGLFFDPTTGWSLIYALDGPGKRPCKTIKCCFTCIPLTISEEMFQSAISSLVYVVQSETATLASIAMEALGHIGLRARLPNLSCDSKPVAGDVLTILHEQLGKLLGGTDIKAIQKIIISLGHISMKETSSTCLNKALDLIFSLCRSKVEDVLFAAGEALSFIWGGVPVTADMILKSRANPSLPP
ncbi:hypothetical protein QJS10_CPB13g00123 [Acorus calamus]|uniref:ARM repeat superfamily protein n=1 Tax=Acorus calamus TaxID=4465 RepID=A0AAV9DFH4_ACOCL|nr:hypothetical protein QJS10_CPB13g00123 [Acorus calamus]